MTTPKLQQYDTKYALMPHMLVFSQTLQLWLRPPGLVWRLGQQSLIIRQNIEKTGEIHEVVAAVEMDPRKVDSLCS